MPHYDPSHQDADWGGYVSISSRKHIPEPKCCDEVHWKPSKRIASSVRNGSTLDLIGGPVPKYDPTTLEPCNWQSEAQAASVRTKTKADQLTETGRSQIRYKSKKVGNPVSLISNDNDTVAASLIEDPFYNLSNKDEPLVKRENFIPLSADCSRNLIGYRSTTRNSLLANLGKELFASAPSLVGMK